MVQELHRHDFFFILVIERGRGDHIIDFTPYKISNNSIFILRPGQVHKLTLKARSTGYLIQFSTDFYSSGEKELSQLLRRVSNRNFYLLDINKIKKLSPVLNYIFKEFSDKEEGHQQIIKANLAIFFTELLRQTQQGSARTATSYVHERLEELLELLETNISLYKQVAQYADMLNLSSYQLNAVTKTTLDKTCSEVINEHIILEAKRYLLATSSQVNQIADLLGYEDASYFIRFFKKHTGYSPEAFRHNFK